MLCLLFCFAEKLTNLIVTSTGTATNRIMLPYKHGRAH